MTSRGLASAMRTVKPRGRTDPLGMRPDSWLASTKALKHSPQKSKGFWPSSRFCSSERRYLACVISNLPLPSSVTRQTRRFVPPAEGMQSASDIPQVGAIRGNLRSRTLSRTQEHDTAPQVKHETGIGMELVCSLPNRAHKQVFYTTSFSRVRLYPKEPVHTRIRICAEEPVPISRTV